MFFRLVVESLRGGGGANVTIKKERIAELKCVDLFEKICKDIFLDKNIKKTLSIRPQFTPSLKSLKLSPESGKKLRMRTLVLNFFLHN